MNCNAKTISIQTNPLVTIIVITYNSSKFVLETLDSAKYQSYQNIELIITDDGSTDNTVEICREWININNNSFINTELIAVKKNTGTSANCNRGVNLAKGKWIKIIAGDDILLSNCIHDNIEYIKLNNDISFLFSDFFIIDNNSNVINKNNDLSLIPPNFKKSSKKQYKELIYKRNFANGATAFFKTSTIKSIGGYDEEIPLLEDVVLWICATKSNYKLFYFPKKTIAYRIHSNSVQITKKKKGVNLYYESCMKAFVKYRLPYGIKHNPFKIYDMYLRVLTQKWKCVKILRLTSIYFYIYLVIKIINKFYTILFREYNKVIT